MTRWNTRPSQELLGELDGGDAFGAVAGARERDEQRRPVRRQPQVRAAQEFGGRDRLDAAAQPREPARARGSRRCTPTCRRPSARRAGGDLRRAAAGTHRAPRARGRRARRPRSRPPAAARSRARSRPRRATSSSAAARPGKPFVLMRQPSTERPQAAMYGRRAAAMPSLQRASAVVPAMRPSRTASCWRGRNWLRSVSGIGRRSSRSQHRRDGALHLRVRPVVADAVAQAVLQVEIETLARRRGSGHASAAGRRASSRRRPCAGPARARRRGSRLFDGGEPPERFAQRKRGAGPDLQDREVIAHERLQAVRRLVVGRVRFEDELRLPADEVAERFAPRRGR